MNPVAAICVILLASALSATGGYSLGQSHERQTLLAKCDGMTVMLYPKAYLKPGYLVSCPGETMKP